MVEYEYLGAFAKLHIILVSALVRNACKHAHGFFPPHRRLKFSQLPTPSRFLANPVADCKSVLHITVQKKKIYIYIYSTDEVNNTFLAYDAMSDCGTSGSI